MQRGGMLFDSHAHFSGDPTEADDWLGRAAAAGVTGVLAVGGSADGNRTALATARRFPNRVWAAVGYDRDHAPQDPADTRTMDRLISDAQTALLSARDETAACVAIGEIGLDFHYHPETAAAQTTLFRLQLELARDFGLPVVVHSRDAEKETLAELARHAEAWPGVADRIGVVHCFTGSPSMADALTAMGYCLGFSGIVTFPNAADVRGVAAAVSENRLLVETDAPYLAPVPMRGRRNEPAFVRHVAETIATVRGQPFASLAATTDRNARRLFGLASSKKEAP